MWSRRKNDKKCEDGRVKCFKCGVEGHKCREYPLWIKRKKEEERLVHPAKGEAQKRKLSKMEQEGAARVARPQEAQQGEWRRSSWKELRKRAEWYCGPMVPQDTELWELGWRGQEAVVMYLKCPRCGNGGCHVEDDQGQEVVPYWRREKMS